MRASEPVGCELLLRPESEADTGPDSTAANSSNQVAVALSVPRSAFVRRVIDACAPRCTSRRRNAHVTESRVVLYRWHPWHGREVFVFGAVAKGEQVVLRCALEPADLARPLEVPQWMFDAAACCRTTLTAAPSVDIETLRELDALVRAATAASGSAVLKAEHRSKPDSGGARANT